MASASGESRKFFSRTAYISDRKAPGGITWAILPGGEDLLLYPVIRGMCKYESLLDGSLDLADIALMNDALAVQADNQAKAQRAAESAKK